MGRRFFYQRIAAAILPAVVLLSAASCKQLQTDYYITEQTGIGVYQSMDQKKDVIRKYDEMINDLSKLPVSFTYAGKDYKGFGREFKEISRNTAQDGAKVMTTVCLEFRQELRIEVCSAIYPDYCAYEWTVYFQNIGSEDSAILENLKCMDILFTGADPVLKGIYGDGGVGDSGPYAPYSLQLKSEKKIHMAPPTGRSTYNYFSLFQPGTWGGRNVCRDRLADPVGRVFFLSGGEGRARAFYGRTGDFFFLSETGRTNPDAACRDTGIHGGAMKTAR